MEYKDDKEKTEESNEELVTEANDDAAVMEKINSVIKAEYEDARDFVDQIGYERAEATNYYLGKKPGSVSSLQSEFIDTSSLCLIQKRIFRLPGSRRTISIILSRNRTTDFTFSTMRLKMRWCERPALSKPIGITALPPPPIITPICRKRHTWL